MFYAQSITPAVAPVFLTITAWNSPTRYTHRIIKTDIQSIIGTPFGISTVQFYPGPIIEFMVVTNSPAVRQSNFSMRFGKMITSCNAAAVTSKICIHSMGHFAAVNQSDLIFRIKSIIGSRIPAQGPAFSFCLCRNNAQRVFLQFQTHIIDFRPHGRTPLVIKLAGIGRRQAGAVQAREKGIRCNFRIPFKF